MAMHDTVRKGENSNRLRPEHVTFNGDLERRWDWMLLTDEESKYEVELDIYV